jgi:hypothetical protein
MAERFVIWYLNKCWLNEIVNPHKKHFVRKFDSSEDYQAAIRGKVEAQIGRKLTS